MSTESQQTPSERLQLRLEDLIAELDQRSMAMSIDGSLPEASVGVAERFIQFSLAGARYAVPVERVIEVAEGPPITPVPKVADWMLGVTNLRGEVLVVLDLRLLMDLSNARSIRKCRMVVVREVEGSGEEALAGLIVDEVLGAFRFDRASIQPAPAAAESQASEYVAGLIQRQDVQVLSLLDLDKLMQSSEVRQFGAN